MAFGGAEDLKVVNDKVREAFLMSSHQRLGAESVVKHLNGDVFKMICFAYLSMVWLLNCRGPKSIVRGRGMKKGPIRSWVFK